MLTSQDIQSIGGNPNAIQQPGSQNVQTQDTLQELKNARAAYQQAHQPLMTKVSSGIQNTAQLLTGIPNVAKDLGQGVVATAEAHGATENKVSSIGDKQTQLIAQAHQLPAGSAERHDLLMQAMNLSDKQNQLAESVNQDVGGLTTPRQAMLDATGAILKTGSFGVGEGALGTGESLATQGAKAGAKVGALQNLGESVTQDKSIPETLVSAGQGAFAGGLAGGAIGKATELGGKAIGKFTTPADESATALKAITPKANELSSSEYEARLGKGKVQPGGLFKAPEVQPTLNEKVFAEKYKSLLQEKNPIKNLNNVVNEISRQNDEVGNYLKGKGLVSQTRSTFQPEELKSYLTNKIKDISDVMVPSEERLTTAKEKMVNNFVDGLSKNDLKSLWEGRKEFDSLANSRFKAFEGTPTLKKEMVRGLRNGVQDFISEKLGNNVYATKMKTMSELFDLKDTLTNKATKGRLLDQVSKWAKENPKKAWILGGIGIGAGTAIGAPKIVRAATGL